MRKQLGNLEEFHEAFNSVMNDSPNLVDRETFELRFKLLKEENEEYLDACFDGNLVEIADALGDQLYIVLGTIITHGLQHVIEEVFERIHQNNMSKLVDGKPLINGVNVFDDTRPIGKVLKPKNWKPVDLKDLIIEE